LYVIDTFAINSSASTGRSNSARDKPVHRWPSTQQDGFRPSSLTSPWVRPTINTARTARWESASCCFSPLSRVLTKISLSEPRRTRRSGSPTHTRAVDPSRCLVNLLRSIVVDEYPANSRIANAIAYLQEYGPIKLAYREGRSSERALADAPAARDIWPSITNSPRLARR